MSDMPAKLRGLCVSTGSGFLGVFHLVVTATAYDVDHAGFLMDPAQYGALSGHGVKRSPHALRLSATPAYDVDHARCFVTAVAANGEFRGREVYNLNAYQNHVPPPFIILSV